MNQSLTYLIIGCGRFGSRAAEKLSQKEPHSKIIAVDKNKEAVKKISHLSVETWVGDGLLFFDKLLSGGKKTDYIIPAVPFHFAFEFVLSRLKPLGAKRRKIPDATGLPNPTKGKSGDLYTSMADFLCPEDCPEPAQYCTVTNQRRRKPLFQILKEMEGPFKSKVLRSEQLESGVGGYRSEVLLGLLEDIKKERDSDRLILISTACRCHAVISALSF